VHAAQKLNVELQIASRGAHSLVNEIARGLHVDLDDLQSTLDTVLAAAQTTPFDGIIASDDYTVEPAAHIAQALGLPTNPPSAARISRRKDLARQALARHGVPVGEHRCIDLRRDPGEQIYNFPFPAVVKPLSLSGSRGVIRVDNDEEFLAACRRVQAIIGTLHDSYERNTLLLEQYIPGDEIAVEGFLRHGEFLPLTIFDKPDPLEGPYFEETYYITPSRLSAAMKNRVYRRIAEACHAYGLNTGPIHAELRLWDGEAWILEVAARTIGGECARLLQWGTGHSLEELVIQHAIGEEQPFQPLEEASGVLMIPTPKAGVLRRVEGVLQAQKVPYVESVRIAVREGHELKRLPEASGYLGFIFARGPSPRAVEKALRTAHEGLNIVVSPLWKLRAL
jgi:biotin carboxylase